MKKSFLIFFIIFNVSLSYSQGFRALTRQGNKALKNNDYATATLNSIKALQQKPNFKKSIALFEQAIVRVNKFYEIKIKQLEANSIPFNGLGDVESAKKIVDIYNSLVEVQNELLFFPEKVKLSNKKLVSDNTRDYNNQLSEAQSRLIEYKLLAAEMAYKNASNLYKSANSKIDFQKAYYAFEEISKYSLAYKNSEQLKADCLQKGILRVGVLPPSNSSGRQDTRFRVINTVVNQIRTNISQNRFISAVNISDRSIGSYANNYSGINADLVIKMTFNDWGYGQRRIREEKYSNQTTRTKKDGTEQVFEVNGTIIETEYNANYDVIVEAILTQDNTIDKSKNLILDFSYKDGYLVGSGKSRANKSPYPLVSKLGQPRLNDYNIKGMYGADGSGSKSSEELFKDAFRNQVINLIASWYK